ncbi:MAG: 16S rRNA (guanine(527)-N(7))-methyltransferase RsmG [Eubacteriales bacterium]|nr:16S rRNA (guanine(527)-N(7))-methyltransferase RsmG [Eubacteriales bacterium]
MRIFYETLKNELDTMGIQYTPEQMGLCEAYFRLVAETNTHTNLTRITGEADAARMHFGGALYLFGMMDLPKGCRVIDIGTGAGFPGIPLKLFRPDISLTLLDASGKKTEFLDRAAAGLGIDVAVLRARAEEAARTALRDSFDIALSRAVAPLRMLLELCVPFLKTGGTLAAWKGESYDQELEDAKNAMSALDCTLHNCRSVGCGAVLLIEKQKPTQDTYPRRFSKIKNQPL